MSKSDSVGWNREVARPGDPTAMYGIEVYVVDDHEGALAALVDHIDRAPGFAVVGSSSSASVAVDEIAVLRPHVAVIDGYFDDRDGLDVSRELHRVAPGVRCVIVTAGVRTGWEPTELSEAGVAAVVLKQLRDFPLLDVVADVTTRQSSGGTNRFGRGDLGPWQGSTRAATLDP